MTVDDDVEVTADFDSAWIVVEPTGDGTGLVTSEPAGVECGGDAGSCAAPFPPGTTLSLSADPDALAEFTGWGGACSGTGTCTVELDDDADADVLVSAGFDTAYLTVDTVGDGSGSVTSAPAGIACPPTCATAYLPGTSVTLTWAAGTSTVFSGWSGGCTGAAPTCALLLDDDTRVDASFDTGRVSASVIGDGAGTVTSDPAGISCPGDCRENLLPGTQVTFTATPTDGRSVFLGWTGSCSGSGTCTVDAGTDPAAIARFDTARLNVGRSGLGSGVVTSDPAGIDCGEDCTERYLPGTTVTLTATATAGSTFGGWSGECTGTGACVVEMDADLQVTAQFNPPGVAGKIVFECDYDVCAMNEDGTGLTNLTSTPSENEYAPTLSADGTRIAYMSNGALEDNPERNIEIATMAVDGTDVRQLTVSPGGRWDGHNYDPAWSPDGSKIAFVTTRGELQRQIYVINADGTGERALTSAADQATRLGPKWSPDGTKIAYTWWLGGMDVYVMDADGSNHVNLSPGTLWTDEKSPGWSPDGTRIAFATNRHYDPMYFNEEIYVMDADGTDLVRVTTTQWIEESPVFSPDGLWIAFSRHGDIWAVEAPVAGAAFDSTDAETKQLTSGPSQDYRPYWAGEPGLPAEHLVRVRKTGTGSGKVTSEPGGIACGRDCDQRFVVGSVVELTAVPAHGSRLVRWSVPCASRTATTCTVEVTGERRVTVRFDRVPVPSSAPGRLEAAG